VDHNIRAAKVGGIGEKKKNNGKKWLVQAKIMEIPGIGVFGWVRASERVILTDLGAHCALLILM
jgi:hypothetical protein